MKQNNNFERNHQKPETLLQFKKHYAINPRVNQAEFLKKWKILKQFYL